MSQFDFGTINPDTKTGTQLAADLGSWRDALNTAHLGASRPAYVQPGMVWVKQTSGTLWQIYVHDGTADLEMCRFNPSTNTAEVAQGIVTTASLAADAVTAAKISSNAVETAKLADLNVTTAKIANAAITGVKVNTGALTFDKINSSAVATIAEIRAGTATGKIVTVDRLMDALADVTLTDAPTIAWDAQTFINGSVTIAANRTMGEVANRSLVIGRTGVLTVGNPGGNGLSWHASFQFVDNEPPALASGKNLFAYKIEGTAVVISHTGGGFA